MRRWHAGASGQAMARTLAAAYLFGTQRTSGRRHTIRSVSRMFGVPVSTVHRLVWSVDPAEALGQAQRLGLATPHVNLSDLPRTPGSDPGLAAALGMGEGEW